MWRGVRILFMWTIRFVCRFVSFLSLVFTDIILIAATHSSLPNENKSHQIQPNKSPKGLYSQTSPTIPASHLLHTLLEHSTSGTSRTYCSTRELENPSTIHEHNSRMWTPRTQTWGVTWQLQIFQGSNTKKLWRYQRTPITSLSRGTGLTKMGDGLSGPTPMNLRTQKRV